MDDFTKEAIREISIVVVIAVIVTTILAQVDIMFKNQRCSTYASEMKLEYKYDWINGCRLGSNGEFTPIGLIRNFNNK